jgi:hypothetical protein
LAAVVEEEDVTLLDTQVAVAVADKSFVDS